MERRNHTVRRCGSRMNPGDRATFTTVIPMNRSIAAYPGSGAKRDIALNNNSFTPIDYVIDVVGYFIENTATALQCTIVKSPTTVVPPNAWTPIDATCPAGYSATGGGFDTVEGTLGYPGVWTTNLPVSSTTGGPGWTTRQAVTGAFSRRSSAAGFQDAEQGAPASRSNAGEGVSPCPGAVSRSWRTPLRTTRRSTAAGMVGDGCPP